MESQVAAGLTPQETLDVLIEGEVKGGQRIPWGSNNTFLVQLDAGDSRHVRAVYKPAAGEQGDSRHVRAVYKPAAGEQPLHDFPWQSLYKREYASYLLAEALGWPRIPTTVIREGPAGVGSIQLYVDCDPNVTYFELVADHRETLAAFAIFDILANNADRKAGHCLLDVDNTIWSIDHGLTFHSDFKLRTVMLEFWGEAMSESLMDNVRVVRDQLASNGELTAGLSELLAGQEFDALRGRIDAVLADPIIPRLDPGRNIPWPLV